MTTDTLTVRTPDALTLAGQAANTVAARQVNTCRTLCAKTRRHMATKALVPHHGDSDRLRMGCSVSYPAFHRHVQSYSPHHNYQNQSDQVLACFGYCVSLGVGDIHNLDGDGDGIERESLRRVPR